MTRDMYPERSSGVCPECAARVATFRARDGRIVQTERGCDCVYQELLLRCLAQFAARSGMDLE